MANIKVFLLSSYSVSTKTILASIICTLLCCNIASAQYRSIGAFHSLKGMGVALDAQNGDSDEFNSFLLYADMAGVFSGKLDSPGIKAVYTYNFGLLFFEEESSESMIYAGLGSSLGWVQDRGEEGYGFSASVVLNFGYKVMFHNRMDISVGIMPEPGMFFRQKDGASSTRFYRNGVTTDVFPYITISYRFR